MEKVMNKEWLTNLLKTDKKAMNNQPNLPVIDWVSNGKSFKRQVKFKLIGANSRENNIFAWVVGTHWGLGVDGTKRFICPEQTQHLKNKNVKCPICEAKRRLLAEGFTEEDLCRPGRYGSVPVFDPVLTSNVKVVVTASDLIDNWDKTHLSVLQQKKNYLAIWLAREYYKEEVPVLDRWDNSNIIEFSRDTDIGKWERNVTFATLPLSTETIAKLKEENEKIYMPDLWPMPTDEQLLDMRTIADQLVENYLEARNTKASVVDTDDDSIPF